MAINVTIDTSEYIGVAQIEVGGKSLHLVSDVAEPSGSVNITANGTYDVSGFAEAVVNVAGDSTPSEAESGTFIGDGTVVASVATSKKCSILLFYADPANFSNPYDNVAGLARSGIGFYMLHMNYNGSNVSGSFIAESSDQFTTSKNHYEFTDNGITFRCKGSGASQVFTEGVAYSWIAW